ncbi:hypothetical protein [Cerasicoccus frondis]|uniref:hypothetical protein n=1 Tax=Cerasicoccus frondis TaxID=490090 RepID=UPI0028529D59|nr:hypothetical protein [Cerasicoccus frondis]
MGPIVTVQGARENECSRTASTGLAAGYVGLGGMVGVWFMAVSCGVWKFEGS